MSWGIRIILAFVLFIGVIFTLASISMRQDINLVSTDYYAHELAYEEQMERLKNHESLAIKPAFKVNRENQLASLSFPSEVSADLTEGQIHFFRPSDHKLDQQLKIELDEEGQQYFDLSQLKKGMWLVKLKWSATGREFYHEMTVVL